MDGVDPTYERCARKTAPAESIKAVTSLTVVYCCLHGNCDTAGDSKLLEKHSSRADPHFCWRPLQVMLASPFAMGPSSCLSCLSVCLSETLVYCGQTTGWIEMPLGTEVGLGPCDIALDGDLAPPRKGVQ